MTIRRPALLLLAIATTAGCMPAGDDQETGSMERDAVLQAREQLDPAVRAALDSGNVAYRENDYERALRHFGRATELGDDVAAAWFGVYMAELALGNTHAAETAMSRARALAPGATLIHPEEPDTAR